MSDGFGLLHPGAMGVSVGAAVRAGGARVLWASAGRGEATCARAGEAGFEDGGTLEAMVGECDVIASVCPPHAALDLARTVAAAGFKGTYVDANAVAPATAREVCAVIEQAGARCVDGGIIGPPAHTAGTTRLYLSGQGAASVAGLFKGSLLEAIPIEGSAGSASALKMCYAAWTKGADALLLSVCALAKAEGVDGALLSEWRLSQPQLEERSERAASRNAYKAWRFVGEMNEIAASYAAQALPDGFHRAAADIYGRLEQFKDTADAPNLAAVVKALRGRGKL